MESKTRRTDTLEQFTVTAQDGARDGAYLFANLAAGDYYAVVVAPSGYVLSLAQSEQVSFGENELANGSLESGSADWSSYGGGTVHVQDSATETPHDGSFSGILTGRSTSAIGVKYDLASLEPDTEYAVSLAMKPGEHQ